jgi:hypothetical protein
LASALHGVARAPLDTDLVADLRPEQTKKLSTALEQSFYVEEEMIRHALQQKGRFNIIHQETMFKVDVFVLKGRPFDQIQLARRVAQVVSAEPERTAYVCTPEDIILAKLEWYRIGGEVSERQWRDVLGVMRVQGEKLDVNYMREWAGELDVLDLLENALSGII